MLWDWMLMIQYSTYFCSIGCTSFTEKLEFLGVTWLPANILPQRKRYTIHASLNQAHVFGTRASTFTTVLDFGFGRSSGWPCIVMLVGNLILLGSSSDLHSSRSIYTCSSLDLCFGQYLPESCLMLTFVANQVVTGQVERVFDLPLSAACALLWSSRNEN